MREHGGAIVNVIADMWHGMPGMAHSGAARAGMLNFTETAALEWAPVRVNCGCAGLHRIERARPVSADDDLADPLDARHRSAAPLRHRKEVSAAIVFLLCGPWLSRAARACASTAPHRTEVRCGPRSARAARPTPSKAFHLRRLARRCWEIRACSH